MDWPVQVQLAQEWKALMGAVTAVLAWTAGVGVFAIVLGSVIAASYRAVRPREFWCSSAGRDVVVLFEEWGVPGFRQTLRVVECSAFEPGSGVACRRGCKDVTRRRLARSGGPVDGDSSEGRGRPRVDSASTESAEKGLRLAAAPFSGMTAMTKRPS